MSLVSACITGLKKRKTNVSKKTKTIGENQKRRKMKRWKTHPWCMTQVKNLSSPLRY